MPWYRWIKDKIDGIPDRFYNLILLMLAAVMVVTMFLPKPTRLAVIAWVVSP